jgi:hypothetical protein
VIELVEISGTQFTNPHRIFTLKEFSLEYLESKQHPGISGLLEKISVFNPACSSNLAERAALAPRGFDSLAGKTLYLVDIGWGGDQAGYDVFQVMQSWFAENIPSVKTVLVHKKGGFPEDDPDLWNTIKSDGDACIIGISC